MEALNLIHPLNGLEPLSEARPVWLRWEMAVLAAVLFFITVTEYVFAYQNAALGIIMALFLALGMYTVSSIAPIDEGLRKCINALTLVPLYILFTSSLPWFFLSQQVLIPAVYSIILALCFWHLLNQGYTLSSLRNLGFSRENLGRYVLLGVALGIPLGSIEYIILTPAPETGTLQLSILARDTLYMLLFVGFGEELLFRGIIQRDVEQAFDWQSGLILSSVLFGILHLTWRSAPEIFFTAAAGFILGYVYYRTRSLVGPVALHAVNNVMLVSVMPYLLPH